MGKNLPTLQSYIDTIKQVQKVKIQKIGCCLKSIKAKLTLFSLNCYLLSFGQKNLIHEHTTKDPACCS